MDAQILNPRFVSDATGKKTDVIIPIDAYYQIIEDLEDLAAIADRKDEPSMSHEELVDELISDGLL